MSSGWGFAQVGRIGFLFSRLAIFQDNRHRLHRFPLTRYQTVSPPARPFQCLHSMADSPPSITGRTYHPEVDVEDLEGYMPGGYHPTLIGDTFCSGRFTIVHKLGGGYSTIWLACDQQLQRYVSLKILVAGASQNSCESEILHVLMKGDLNCVGRQFIPLLLDQFSFDGPNGHHQCLVAEPTGCSIASSKENSTNFMFPRDAARSITAQLIMGLSYLHANDVCHGGMFSQHSRGILFFKAHIRQISTCTTFFFKPETSTTSAQLIYTSGMANHMRFLPGELMKSLACLTHHHMSLIP